MKFQVTKGQASGFLAGLLASGLLVAAASAQEDPKRALNSPALVNSLQYGYSQATIATADANLVHVAGQVGMFEDGPNDFESQVDRSFDALLATLDVAGMNADNVVKITLFASELAMA